MTTVSRLSIPIRVMMIGPYPESSNRIDGGVAAATMYLSQELASRGDVELVGARIARKGDESREDNTLGWPVVDVPLGHLSLSTFYRRQRRQIDKLLRRYDPHIVHAQGTDLAGILAVTSGRPAVVTVHGLLGECARYQTDPVSKLRATLAALLTERRTIRRTTDLIAISPYVAKYYRDDIRGRIHEVPNAVAAGFFRVRRSPERGRLLYAGRIANGKGILELIHAVARNSTTVTKLVLAGATPDHAYGIQLRKVADALGLRDRVNFVGLLTESELVEEFARAEALILPSLQETAPMVVQQAMASGLAVVATKVGGIPDQIRDEATGLLFEAGDVDGLSSLLGRLGNEPSLSRRLGEAAKAEASVRYQASTVAQATIGIYRSILSFAHAGGHEGTPR